MLGQLALGATAIGATLWLIFRKKSTGNVVKNDDKKDDKTTDTSGICITSDAGMTLATAQQILKSLGYTKNKTPGCGPNTKADITAFQQDVNAGKYADGGDKLAVTGIVDKRTAAALWAYKPVSLTPTYTFIDTSGMPNDQPWVVENPGENNWRAYVVDPVNPGYIGQSVTGYSQAEVEARIKAVGSANPYNSSSSDSGDSGDS